MQLSYISYFFTNPRVIFAAKTLRTPKIGIPIVFINWHNQGQPLPFNTTNYFFNSFYSLTIEYFGSFYLLTMEYLDSFYLLTKYFESFYLLTIKNSNAFIHWRWSTLRVLFFWQILWWLLFILINRRAHAKTYNQEKRKLLSQT